MNLLCTYSSVVHEIVSNDGVGPAPEVLQALWQVPVVHGDHRMDSMLGELFKQLLVVSYSIWVYIAETRR